MKTKLLILSAALFSLITISCKSDATKCVDNMIETIANAKSVEDLEKISSASDIFFSLYKPRYDNGEEYKQYMHDVVNELIDRFDEIRVAGKNNINLKVKGFSFASESEMKERCESLHEWINEAEVSIDENKVTIKNGWEVITFSKD